MITLYVVDMIYSDNSRHLIIFDNDALHCDETGMNVHIPIPHNMTEIGIIRFMREVLQYTEDRYNIQLFNHSNVNPNFIIPATINHINYPEYEIITIHHMVYETPVDLVLRRRGNTNPSEYIDLGSSYLTVFADLNTVNEVIEAGLVESDCNILVPCDYDDTIDIYRIRDGKIRELYEGLPVK